MAQGRCHTVRLGFEHWGMEVARAGSRVVGDGATSALDGSIDSRRQVRNNLLQDVDASDDGAEIDQDDFKIFNSVSAERCKWRCRTAALIQL
jgi:hypothetical protein